MGALRLLLTLVVVGSIAAAAFGQGAAAVQLPTYSYFATGTTVSVPDRGAVPLGSVHRGRSAASSFGAPLLPRTGSAVGSGYAAAGSSVSVTVHDFDAIDRQILAGSERIAASPVVVRGEAWRDRLQAAELSVAGRPVQGVAAIEARLRQADQEAAGEAAQWIERGRLAETEGKPNVAKIYYQMAARRAVGLQRQQVLDRIAALHSSPEASSSGFNRSQAVVRVQQP
ncbi:MAG: hypothetical protein GXY83_36810 [Rhodopirellula sp.]|nr:hypothetical protein [Rhodopirellula sp.]